MRAVVITKAGGPEALEIQDRPVPTPGPTEVLVRVHATALNRADLFQRQGRYPAPPGAPADIPGLEFAGEVERCGANVTTWRRGDRVFGITGGGAHAEFLIADEQCLARVPANLSWTDAAAVPEAFMTAHDAMIVQAGLTAGETVLVHAVGSGVGLATTQLARVSGATPYGTARTAEKIERARAEGLEAGVVVGDDVAVIATWVSQWTSGRGIDVTMDLVGGPYLPASIEAAALRGRIMLIGTIAGGSATVSVGKILAKRLTLRGTVLRARSLDEKRAVTAAFARDVVPLFASGALHANVDRVFDLAEIRAAHTLLESNQMTGKVVLRVSPEAA